MRTDADIYALCAENVRAVDYDLWFSGLLTPELKRHALYALYAFTLEISQLRCKVSEPFLGEIRLQWWRDVLTGERRSEGEQHPQARALLETIEFYKLPLHAFVAIIDAHIRDLYDDPFLSLADLEGYAGETISARLRLATLILGEGQDPGGAEACGHAGVAHTLLRILLATPQQVHKGVVVWPVDLMARFSVKREDILTRKHTTDIRETCMYVGELVRDHYARSAHAIAALPATVKPAFVPLTTIPLLLDRLREADYNPFTVSTHISHLRRQWRMWRGIF
jgi:phytoene synthase